MDVLASGPERDPRRAGPVRSRLRDLRSRLLGPDGGSRRRRGAAALAVLAAFGVLIALRAGIGDLPRADQPQAAPRAETGGAAVIRGRIRLQPPPFDRLPGRTPIPLPTPVGPGTAAGALPPTGAPGQRAAHAAAQLVVGRYCRWPAAYQVQTDQVRSWRSLEALVVRGSYGGSRVVATLQLSWTGRSYAWLGSEVELSNCS